MPSSDLTLRIDNGDETVLPTAVLDGPLSLAEIGALVLLTALAEDDIALDHPRIVSLEAVEAIKSLRERGVFEVAVDGTNVSMRVVMDKALPTPETL